MNKTDPCGTCGVNKIPLRTPAASWKRLKQNRSWLSTEVNHLHLYGKKATQPWLCLCPNIGNAVFPLRSLCVECDAMHLHSNLEEIWDRESSRSPPNSSPLIQPWRCILSGLVSRCYNVLFNSEPSTCSHYQSHKRCPNCLSPFLKWQLYVQYCITCSHDGDSRLKVYKCYTERLED